MALLPDCGGGIEYPGVDPDADASRAVAVHELAHQWFYAMVGDSQARDPWLDEAFATYAEEEIDGTGRRHQRRALDLPGTVGGSMADYAGRRATYFDAVTARARPRCSPPATPAGPDEFDAALRCYVNANAWRIATPGRPRPRPWPGCRPAVAVLRRGRRAGRGRRARAERASAAAEQSLHPADALDQVVVAQRVGQPEVAGRAERLARHDGDLGLVQDQRRPARADVVGVHAARSTGRAGPSTDG